MTTIRSLDYRPLGSLSQAAMTVPLASARTPADDPQQSKETPADRDGASRNDKVVAEATRLLSLLMEFAELERRRTEKDRS